MAMKVHRFIQLTKKANEIVDSDLSWKDKYNMIFSDEISGAIRDTGVSFDWYDPDCDYSDDVMAYVRAINDRKDELEKSIHLFEKETLSERARNKIFALETNLSSAVLRLERGNYDGLKEIFEEMQVSLEQLKEVCAEEE